MSGPEELRALDERALEAAARVLHGQQEIDYDWGRERDAFIRQARAIITTYLDAAEPSLASPAGMEGWIEWDGGKMPVPADADVFIKYRLADGTVKERDSPDRAAWFDHLNWWEGTPRVAIIAYRPAAPRGEAK